MLTVMEKERVKEETPVPANKILCPFLLKPFEGCYCASTSSLDTESTIFYCGGNFEKCDIYRKHMEG